MKTFSKFAVVVCMILQFTALTFAQIDDSSRIGIFKKGNWELNFSASIGNLTSTRSSSSSGMYGSSSDSKSSSMFYVQLGVIPAYFLTDGLSIEPEINVLIQSQEGVDSKPSLSFLANLSYTFNLPEKKFAPFIRIGYGISNSIQIPAVIGGLGRVSDELEVNILNAGAGFKFLISRNLLIRTELNFRRCSYGSESSGSFYSMSYDYSITSISGIFGFSVLF